MLHIPVILLSLLLLIGEGSCNEEDNLRNALNSITNRQRQLTTNFYVVPNKDVDKEVPYDDELMYLDSSPRDYDISNRETIGYGYQKSQPKNYRFYEDDKITDVDSDDYQKDLKERLLERLALDILKDEDDNQKPPQKKSFFREREFNEIPENLQNLYPGSDGEDIFVSPSSFRERAKTKPRFHRRLVKSYDTEDESDEYLDAFNALMEKYKGSSWRGIDPETLTNEDVEEFLKYLGDKEDNYYEYQNPTQEYYPSNSRKRGEFKRASRGKRYWLGSGANEKGERYLIQKRSAIEEKPTGTEKINATVNPISKTILNKTKSSKKVESEKPDKYAPKKFKGQKEQPIDLKSLKPLNIKKKSVDWSNYFGVDKRQKKSNWKDQRKNDVLLDQYLQSYILQSVRNSAFNNRGGDYRYFPKRNYLSNDQFETDEDLRTAEDLIIDNVLKYTGAHEGVTDPKEIERFRENVINELAAAYNLEKLRKEIFEDTKNKKTDDMAKHHHSNKRVAVKKESAELDQGLKIKHNDTFFNHEHSKKSIYSGPYRTSESSVDCPVINQILNTCQKISYEIRDFEGAFTPFCALHQICRVCGPPQECDTHFMLDITTFCKDLPTCPIIGQRILFALKDVKNRLETCEPCIADILKYIPEK